MTRSPLQANFPMVGRRKFIADSLLTAGTFLVIPALTKATDLSKIGPTYMVGDIMDMFIHEVPGGVLPGQWIL